MTKLYSKSFLIIVSTLFLTIPIYVNAEDSKSIETITVGEIEEEAKHLISVRGFVVDDFGEPMVGVEVYATGSNKKCITNTEGRYTIWAHENDLIKFSQIGVTTKKEKVTLSRILNVALSIEEE